MYVDKTYATDMLNNITSMFGITAVANINNHLTRSLTIIIIYNILTERTTTVRTSITKYYQTFTITFQLQQIFVGDFNSNDTL